MTPAAGLEREPGLLVVLSGPSGVGKGTVVARAQSARGREAARLRRSVSVTTRTKRGDERDGTDYFFVSPEEFEGLAAAGELLESARYLDHEYGTPREWVDRQLEGGYDVVLEIEVQGAMQVRQHRRDAVLIYMVPPSWAALRRRLARRRSESCDLQAARLAVARQEMSYVGDYDYVIVNDRVSRAARRFLAILEAERSRVARIDIDALLEGTSG